MPKNFYADKANPPPASASQSTQPTDSTTKSSQPISRAQKKQKPAISVRNQLLLTILPVVLLPLAVGSLIMYKTNQKSFAAQTKPYLQKHALLTGEAVQNLLEEELELPDILAHNPLVINAARSGSQRAEAMNLSQIPIKQVEKMFSASRLLKPTQDLNDYLRTTAKIGKVAQLSITEKHGFNVGYTIPPYDFVQRDEEWWQKGKSQRRWVSAPDFDPSVRLFSISMVRAIADPQSGEFLGVVKSVVPASRFDRVAVYLEQIELKDSEIVQIVDISTGGVVTTATAQGASSTRKVKGDEAIVKVGASLVKAFQDPKLNLEQVMQKLQQQYPLQNLTFNRFNPQTNENEPSASFLYQGKYYTITTIPKINWVSVASIDQGEILSTDGKLMAIFAVTALALCLGVLITLWLLARQISTPLINLARVFEQVRAGNLDVVAQPVGNRETQTLAGSLNKLVKKIRSLKQQQTDQDELQQELLQLLSDVEKLSTGDLTVKANIGTTPVSTVTGYFNIIIDSLKDIVVQVKQAAAKVNSSIAQNENATSQLAEQTLQQTTQIKEILNSVEEMNQSIQAVDEKAKVALKTANDASTQAEAGGKAIEQTVATIYQLRSTVALTVKKTKHLAEFSQEVVQAIAPLNQIAMQTKVLALNANIETAKLVAENPGLATVTEEVNSLAERLATAKTDIEQIVDNVQWKISELMEAMEQEIGQIVTGTSSIEKTQQDMKQMREIARQLEQLIQSIADDTITHAQTSRSLTQLKEKMILAAKHTADSSLAVSGAWQETFVLARQLQVSVETFKIGDET